MASRNYFPECRPEFALNSLKNSQTRAILEYLGIVAMRQVQLDDDDATNHCIQNYKKKNSKNVNFATITFSEMHEATL